MSLINVENEKKIFEKKCLKLAKKIIIDDFFNTKFAEEESYYVSVKKRHYFSSDITEYGFETPVELKYQLSKAWCIDGNDPVSSLLPVIQVSTFKMHDHSPQHSSKRFGAKQPDDEIGLPMFVYNF